MSEKKIKKIFEYKGKILNLEKYLVKTYNDKFAYREIIEHKRGVAIIATFNEKIILISQYRIAVNKNIFEIPAGIIEENETPLQSAKRELREETGYDANNFKLIGSFYPSPGYTTERLFLVEATDLFWHPLKPDFDENIDVLLFSKEEIYKLIQENSIDDMKTYLAINMLFKNK